MTVNPFEYQRIITGKSFIDREKELNELKRSLRSKENRIIYSPRRLGKSSLIKELFRLIGNEYITIYVDLWDCFSEADIAEKLLRAAITASYNKIEKAAVAFKEWLTSVRPFFSIGSDGTIDVKIDLIDKEMFLGEAIALLQKIAEKKGKKVVVAFDEFQEVGELSDQRIEKIMRSRIQQQDKVVYIFSGSKEHILRDMFDARTRPFYRQAKPLPLGAIPFEEFSRFIKGCFAEVGIKVTKEILDEIQRYTRGNPQRTQQVCHELFERVVNQEREFSSSLVKEVIIDICLNLDTEFIVELDNIKARRQKQLLKAMAIHPTSSPLSAVYIQEHSLGSTGSVQSALRSLINKGVLTKSYDFVDPLFGQWMKLRHLKELK